MLVKTLLLDTLALLRHKAATITQLVSGVESKPGDIATCVQANTVIQQHPNNHAITYYDVSICDCLAGSQIGKETQAHDVACKSQPTITTQRVRSCCSHAEKEDQRLS